MEALSFESFIDCVDGIVATSNEILDGWCLNTKEVDRQ